jgi:hypothetical protein
MNKYIVDILLFIVLGLLKGLISQKYPSSKFINLQIAVFLFLTKYHIQSTG